MKSKILTIMLLAFMSTGMTGQSFKITECDYNGLYEQMFEYIYIVLDSPSSFFKDENPYNYKYIVIQDMIAEKEIIKDDEIPADGLLGFTPTTIHPAHTSLVLKSGNDCEIICTEFQTLDDSYRLHRQLSQAYEFFQKHQPQLDVELFPQYAKIICDVFIENSRYLE